MAVDFEKLVLDLVTPLVIHPEDLLVKKFSEDETSITIQVLVNQEDLGNDLESIMDDIRGEVEAENEKKTQI